MLCLCHLLTLGLLQLGLHIFNTLIANPPPDPPLIPWISFLGSPLSDAPSFTVLASLML